MRVRPHRPLRSLVLPALLALTGACGAESASSVAPRGASEGPSSGQDGSNKDSAGGFAPSPAADAGATPRPAEAEVEGAYDTPAATGSVVWSANAISGRVTAIVGATLERVTANAGNGPTSPVAIPGAADMAAVLNDLSNDATILRYANRRITTETVKTAETANAWAVSPTGTFAIAWSDAVRMPSAVLTQGFQEIDVVRVATPARATRLAVGYRPFAIAFNAAGSQAVVASRDGLTVIDCPAEGTPGVLRHVPIPVATRTGTTNPYEFALTPDGRFAVVRAAGSSAFDVLTLESGAKRSFALDGPITDIDLSVDGTRVYAVVARPGAGDGGSANAALHTVLVDAPAGALPSRTELPIPDLGSISVAADGSSAVFYTNAVDQSRVVVMGFGEVPTFRTVELYAPVLAVFLAPNGEHALALHKPVVTRSPSDPIGAFSLVPLKTALPSRIIATPGKVSAVATSPEGDRFVVLERSDERAAFAVHVAEVPALNAKRYELASPPTSVGLLVSAKRAFASQVHPQGRMSFVDLPTGLVQTLTGFELGAR